MGDVKYKYVPDLPEEFKCRVPLPATLQALVNNGRLKEELKGVRGASIRAKEELGFIYEVPAGVEAADTMQVVSFRDSYNTNDIEYKNDIIFNQASKASMLLCTHTLSLDKFNTDEVVNIVIERDAYAEIVVMQNEHNFSNHKVSFNIEVKEGGYLKVNVVTLHGAKLDNLFDVKLVGKSARCELNGLYLADGKQTVNNNITMSHLVPECTSSQLFKGILDNEAVATFTGRIVVARDAQKTEAFQANHNLLISPLAKAYAQPQLEIYADDVKCSHGATSGSLDPQALFYMRSRGIGASEAKLLQQLAFTYEVLEKINNEQLRQRLADLVESRLRGEFGHCDNCSMNCC